MKKHSVSVVGRINHHGAFVTPTPQDIGEFCSKWKNTKAIMQVTVYPDEGNGLQRGYYFKVLVPCFQHIYRDEEGERLTLAETDLRMRQNSPSMVVEIPREEAGGFELVRVLTAYECSELQLRDHIDYMIMHASRDYSYVIPDAKRG